MRSVVEKRGGNVGMASLGDYRDKGGGRWNRASR